MNFHRVFVNSNSPGLVTLDNLMNYPGFNPDLVEAMTSLLNQAFNNISGDYPTVGCPGYIYWVETPQGEIISLAMIGPSVPMVDTYLPEECTGEGCQIITNVVTTPEYQGQGWASFLMRTILEENPNTRIYLKVDPKNSSAYHIYRKLGFLFRGWVGHHSSQGFQMLHLLEYSSSDPCLF